MKKALWAMTLLLPLSVLQADVPYHMDVVSDIIPVCESKYNRIIGTIQDVRRGKTIEYIECVEPVPVLEVSAVNTVGDRFRPIKFDVDYTLRGRPKNYPVEATLGNVRVDGSSVTIHSDGTLGTGTVVIADEEFKYEFVEEPRCTSSDNYDCNGYYKRSPSTQQYVHYGLEDDRVVKWEITWVQHYSQREWDENGYEEMYPNGMPILEQRVLNRINGRIEEANEMLRRSGVFVELVISEMFYYPYDIGRDPVYGLRELRDSRKFGRGKSDLLFGSGYSRSGTCGVAFVSTRFVESYPPVSVATCGVSTMLHEIGHSVGLAHGPNNVTNAASGYIYPWFGHGWYDVCEREDTIMSYGESRKFFSNSDLTCGDVFGDEERRFRSYQDSPAGNRDYTDEAYVLNMVRYSVSLIHDEHSDKRRF
jgi:hypothetical protein